MNIDERIEHLELMLKLKEPGTVVQRVLNATSGGRGWHVAIGEAMQPKKHFFGSTIHDALCKAESELL